MDVFSWSKNCETGLPEVDKQHRHLFDVTNDFGRLLATDEVNLQAIEKLLTDLVQYTEYHFQEEERLMALLAVDPRHELQHQKEHKTFVDDVLLLAGQCDFAQGDAGKNLFEYLINWLVYHILGSDMNLARQVEAITAGSSPEQAYQLAEQEKDKSTDMLLTALTNLFHQVSSRNKQLIELNQSLEEKVKLRTADLLEANAKLEFLATTDVLTGLPNRRYAMQCLAQLWAEALAKGAAVGCMLIDADGFKQVNDTYGHDAGDIVLQELAKQLKHAVRTDDVVCRLGGDEFLIICPNTDQDGALQAAQNVHAAVEGLKVGFRGGCWTASISVGVAASKAAISSPEELIKAADNGVYAAKGAGRNCVRMG